MAGKRTDTRATPRDESFSFDLSLLSGISGLVIDSSSLILAQAAGFLDALVSTADLHAPASVIAEVRDGSRGQDDPAGLDRVVSHRSIKAAERRDIPGSTRSALDPGIPAGGLSSADLQVILLAADLRLPVSSDDFSLLATLEDLRLPGYPSLVILNLLLLKTTIDIRTFEVCRSKLSDLIQYPEPVYRACVDLHWEIRKHQG